MLQDLWDEVLAGSLDSEVRACVIGVKAQMQTYGFFFGMSLARLVLCHGDNLSVALQSSNMSDSEGQQIAALTVSSLEKLRTDAAFSIFWESTVRKSNDFDMAEPQLPRKRRRTQRHEPGS